MNYGHEGPYSVTLSNGVRMPYIGLGTWQMKGNEVKTAVKWALAEGYRMIDTATIFYNEEEIGDAIHEAIQEGLVRREELFIITKAWVTQIDPLNIEKGLRGSLARMRLSYVDAYLAHYPTAFSGDMSEAQRHITAESVWSGLEELYKMGLTRSIGVANFNALQIQRILKTAVIPIHMLQVEAHVYFPQYELQTLCRNLNIALMAYAPLGSPTRRNYVRSNGVRPYDQEALSELEDKNVISISRKYGKTPAQVLLRYLLDRGIIITPKSSKPARIKENMNLFDFRLTPEDFFSIDTISTRHQRLFATDFCAVHPEDPFRDARVV